MRIFFGVLLLTFSQSVISQVWSPDGSQIAFFYIHEVEDIYTVNVDRTQFKIVDNHPERDFMPDWSFDGNRILFTSVRDGRHQIYEMSALGGNVQRLIVSEHEDADGHYAPGGDKVVFSSNREGNSDLFIYDRNTNETSSLINTVAFEYTPRWSPDGESVLFKRSSEEFGASNLFTIDIEGGELVQVTDQERGEFHQNWSPDGSRICYVVVIEGVFEIRVMNMTSRDEWVLMSKEGYQAFSPNWSPDGKFIAFTRDVANGQEEGYPALFVVDMEGNERKVTDENSF